MRNTFRALVAVAALAAFSVSAQQAEPNCAIDPDWTQQKINETLNACKSQAQPVAPEVIVQDVSAYAEVAKGVAEAIGIAAREVGVAVDEFIKTDAGKMTVALIVWHVAGEDLKGIVFGIPTIVFAVWLWFALTARIKRTGEYITIKNRWGTERSIHKQKSVADLDGPDGFSYLVASSFCILLVCISVAHIF